MSPPIDPKELTDALATMSDGDLDKIGMRRKGHRKRVKNPNSRLRLGLSLADQALVMAGAKHYYDNGGGHGSQRGLDGTRLYQTVTMMMLTGLHREDVEDPNLHYIHVSEGKLLWTRPKKSGQQSVSDCPLPQEVRLWAEDYIAWLRARRGIHYLLLTRVLWDLGKRIGLAQKLSCLSLRHTAGVNMARRKHTAFEICQRLNCSMAVAVSYLRQAEDVAALEASGQLKMPGQE